MGHIQLFEDYTNSHTSNNNLYHSTDLDSFFSIIFLNKLAGITPQEIEGVVVRGVSCTKDKNFIYKNKDITLELSSSLMRKWKTYEVDFFATDFGKERAKQHNLDVIDEKEMFVVTGDITSENGISPLSKYLISITFNKKDIVLPEDVKELLETNFNTIKIFDYKNKDITKKIIQHKGIGFDMSDFMRGFEDFQ